MLKVFCPVTVADEVELPRTVCVAQGFVGAATNAAGDDDAVAGQRLPLPVPLDLHLPRCDGEDSTWYVTGTSYLTSLELAETSLIRGKGGKQVVMTVDGAETPLVQGCRYTGRIVLTLAG